jgi:hypothetical protein
VVVEAAGIRVAVAGRVLVVLVVAVQAATPALQEPQIQVVAAVLVSLMRQVLLAAPVS